MSCREHRFTAKDGLSLYFRDYGDPGSAATPVLCLGGLFRNARDFDPIARILAEERRVLCPDLRGRGRSDHDPDWRNYRPRIYLDDIASLLAFADVSRVVAVGTSFGGMLAMALPAVMPFGLAGLVLNEAGPEVDWDVNIVKPIVEAQGAPPDFWPYFRGLRPIPLLAFRGEVSDAFTVECFLRMGREYPEARLVSVPRTGHAPTLAEPECVAALDAFLRDL